MLVQGAGPPNPQSVSDDKTEHQIRDRLSFMCFLGLDRDPHISDAKTIWLFRETLAQMVVVAILFERIEAKMAICEGENTGTADEADNSMGWSIPSS